MTTDAPTLEYDGDIYRLGLHQFVSTRDTNRMITRVPGGWIYASYHTGANQITETFVPFNNEFQPKGETPF